MRNSINLVTVSSIFFLFLSGCSGFKTRSEIEDPKSMGRSAPVGSTTVGGSDATKAPPPVQVKMPKVGVVLGPGGAKSYAHVGVLKELEKAKIPVHAIVGVEWGALVAGIYSINASVNDLEWKLFKLDKKDLVSKGLFSSGGGVSVGVLKKYLTENLGSAGTGKTRARFACPALSLRGGVMVWQDQGSIQSAVENCLPSAPTLKLDRPMVASTFSVGDAIEKVRAMGAELVILVDVLDRGNLFKGNKDDAMVSLLWFEARNQTKKAGRMANEVIPVVTSDYPLDDFENQRQLVQMGQRAGESAAKRISDRYGF